MVRIVASGVEMLPLKNTTKTYDHKPFTTLKRKTPTPTNTGTPSRSSYVRQFEKFNQIGKKIPTTLKQFRKFLKQLIKKQNFPHQKKKKSHPSPTLFLIQSNHQNIIKSAGWSINCHTPLEDIVPINRTILELKLLYIWIDFGGRECLGCH